MGKDKPIRKKLIEVALPLEAINKASAREKSIRHGHPSTLHLWWARRPLAACRAVLFGQLVDDPSAWPEKFNGEEAQEVERQRLFRIIEQLVLWENSNNENVLNAARWEIARSVAWGLGEEPPNQGDGKAILAYLQIKAPPVYDPFCGGGSIPLEAQRLGLRAYGSDLNPVAVLISKALIEIPPKFADQPPINPDARKKLNGASCWNGKGAHGLAEDVRYYGNLMREEAEKCIGHLYPKADVTDEAILVQPNLAPLKGQQLTVIAWLWARTVASPNPAARGAHVPLISSFMLSTKEGKKAWVVPTLDPSAQNGYRFEVLSGSLSNAEEAKAKQGTKADGSGTFQCLLTNTAILSDHIKLEGNAGRIAERLMAVVADGPRGRVFLAPDKAQESAPTLANPNWTPDGDLFEGALGFRIPAYGFKSWKQLFTTRQLAVLTSFSDLVGKTRERVLADALAAKMPSSGRLEAGGTGAEAYADAIATYLGFLVDQLANHSANVCGWNSANTQMRSVFARHALPMVWDFAECNVLGDTSGGFGSLFERMTKGFETLGSGAGGRITQCDARTIDDNINSVFATDPPYYDNIGYADLSDFFYVWTRPTLRDIWPTLFATVLVPKSEELVATPARHGGKTSAANFFLAGIEQAFSRISAASALGSVQTIFYAFKQSEDGEEGAESTGWSTFLQGLHDGGLAVDGTWPIRTEKVGRVRDVGANALASSIVLVCRKRPANAAVTTRAAFLGALKRELPPALKLLQAGNVAPVDLAQASIGPGMGIFTRHSKVLEADDSAMSVKTALQLINSALDDFLSEQESEYDAETRYAITWFETHGMDSSAYGDAETLAKARNVSVSGVADAGLVESKGGKVRLLKRSEMGPKWDPLTDKTLTVWECAQHLIRVLEADGETAAAALLIKLGSRADATRDLAYRLYQICERKKWADEARAYNGLVVAWPELQKLASQQASAAPQAPAQATLI